MTETQKKVAQWQAGRPAFTGKVVAQPLPGKQSRRAAKARAITKANKA